ncbi:MULTISPECIES: isochorismatase family protein [Micromonospora]|uniref:isochorismatase family protein n=1 Tax=Micromonospora TaxID=1873 RepID=UPI0003EEBB4D|nr:MULTISPECIES: isochorismatase family protein [Micromonospora]EWM64942.1 hydrolase, isochorismatase family [Micromonospora sp. M42]MBP1782099.1 maleamate amidohydrolase [Micromonospora sp. HB375]MCK1804736.1 isochorismatase family protein [Micromonospora sp. R42106]MCK1830156.1 isochorismatase family protein [Micromonospora sp. R42003]MCK1841789.1 isochorismatase family protein [Micromonospora sp. R42004]
MDDLQGDYRRAGFGGDLGRGSRRALLLVDLVRAYLDPASPLYAGDTDPPALRACAALLDTARRHGVPVIHTRVELSPGGADGGLFARKVPALRVFEHGSAFADAPPSLAPAPGETVVTKQYASAFFGTSLASTLRVLGVDALVIGGASTSGCVRASAVDALQHGFVPLVVAEACLDRDPRPHQAALFDLGAKYAEVLALDEATALLGPGGL